MSTRISFWLETRRALAQWTGVVLASVVSGLLLGVFRHQGIAYKPALEMALPVGFLLALLFWIWITRRVSVAIVPIPVAVSTTVLTVEGDLGVSYSYLVNAGEMRACQSSAA